jgi:prenyltransferase beta subunit
MPAFHHESAMVLVMRHGCQHSTAQIKLKKKKKGIMGTLHCCSGIAQRLEKTPACVQTMALRRSTLQVATQDRLLVKQQQGGYHTCDQPKGSFVCERKGRWQCRATYNHCPSWQLRGRWQWPETHRHWQQQQS